MAGGIVICLNRYDTESGIALDDDQVDYIELTMEGLAASNCFTKRYLGGRISRTPLYIAGRGLPASSSGTSFSILAGSLPRLTVGDEVS